MKLHCDVDQTDITNHFSVLGKTDIFKVEKIPFEKILMKEWKKRKNETHLNHSKNWISFASYNCEEELQTWNTNDAFALVNSLLSKALSTFFFQKKRKTESKKKQKQRLDYK